MAEIPLLEPFLGGNERKYIEEALAANQPSVGPFVERFEEAFAEYVGSSHAVAVSSGTAALHLAMRVLDVGPGDEVLAPAFSFVATVNPILYVGAMPVLIDAEPRTWGMDPDLAIEEIREARPKAVVVAALYGHPAEMGPIVDWCARYGIPVVEDASESLGAIEHGFMVGTVGKIGCFSFNGNKIITTGQGGMLVTDDAELAARARHLRAQARLPGPGYVHDEVGFNYRMPNLAAAMGLAQLEQLPHFIQMKHGHAGVYDRAFPPGMRPPWPSASYDPTFWLYCVRVQDPDVFRSALAAEGIESRPLWTPLHTMAPYRHLPRLGGAVAEDLHAHGLSLPSSVGLTVADQSRVIEAIKKVLTNRRKSSMLEAVQP